MKVIAVDPGYDRLGVAVIEKQAGAEVLLYSGCIETDKRHGLSERIHAAGREFEALLKAHTPQAIGIESLYFNKNQKTAMGVAQMRGVILYLAHESGVSVYEFTPQEIKVATTGYGKSDKHAVTQMVKRLVRNTPATALDDEYDAIAIGVTTLAHLR